MGWASVTEILTRPTSQQPFENVRNRTFSKDIRLPSQHRITCKVTNLLRRFGKKKKKKKIYSMFLPELIHSGVSDDCIGELFDRWRHSSRVQSDGTLYAVDSKHLSVLLHSWEGTTKHWLLYSYQLTVTTYNIILSSHSVTNSFPPHFYHSISTFLHSQHIFKNAC